MKDKFSLTYKFWQEVVQVKLDSVEEWAIVVRGVPVKSSIRKSIKVSKRVSKPKVLLLQGNESFPATLTYFWDPPPDPIHIPSKVEREYWLEYWAGDLKVADRGPVTCYNLDIKWDKDNKIVQFGTCN